MKIYGEEIINCKSREEFNQRFTTYAMDCRGGMQCIAPYKTVNKLSLKRKHIATDVAHVSKIQYAEHVHLFEKDHKKLVEEFGEEKAKAFYKELSDWKNDKPKTRWRKDDYASIRRWVIAATSETEKRFKSAPETNKEHAQEMKKKISNQLESGGFEIEFLSEYLEIRRNGQFLYVLGYDSRGFNDQFESMLRKCGFTW